MSSVHVPTPDSSLHILEHPTHTHITCTRSSLKFSLPLHDERQKNDHVRSKNGQIMLHWLYHFTRNAPTHPPPLSAIQ